MMRLKIVLSMVFVFFLVVCGGTVIFLTYIENDRLQGWNKYLSNLLPSDVVDDLCSRNLIPANLGNCRNGHLQIQLRSVPDILRADTVSDAKLDEVNQLFGNYLVGCEKDTLLPNSIRCQYNLAGYYFAINYDANTNIITSMDIAEP